MSDDICELVLKFEAGEAAREVAEKRQALVRAERSLALRRRELDTYQHTGRKPRSKTFGALMCEVARIAGVVRSGVDA